MLPVLPIGPLAVPVPGLLLIVAVWVGLSVAERKAAAYGLSADQVYSLAMAALAGGFIGAQLSYVLVFPQAFLADLWSIVSLNPGLLDPWGGAAAALIVWLILAQRKNLAVSRSFDAITPALGVAAIGLALSNLASGAAYGTPASLPWAIPLWEASRHPVQLYEALAAALALWAILPGRAWLQGRPPGWTFWYWAAGMAASRLFFEAFRGDSALLINGIRQAQVAAWLILAIALWQLSSRLKPQADLVKKENEHDR
jgi:prolipoprotein diacylglyceryltransferase